MEGCVLYTADYVNSILSPWKDSLNPDIVRFLLCQNYVFEILQDNDDKFNISDYRVIYFAYSI